MNWNKCNATIQAPGEQLVLTCSLYEDHVVSHTAGGYDRIKKWWTDKDEGAKPHDHAKGRTR